MTQLLDGPWARSAPAVGGREVLLRWLLAPLMDLYTRYEVVGRERLDNLAGPVLFVATHASHMDTPAVLRALPRTWRRRTAVAAAADYFYRTRLVALTVSLAFNAVPVQRRGAAVGTRAATELDLLIEEGWSVVLFAEGTRSRDGTVGKLHSGAAVLAARHDIPLVPVFVSGTHAVMPVGRRFMRVGRNGLRLRRLPVEVRFGAAVHAREGEHRTEVMERVRHGLEASGAVTTPDERTRSPRPAAK